MRNETERVLSHGLLTKMEADFGVEALEEAFAKHRRPKIFSTNRGSQFTSEAFAGVLVKNGVFISLGDNGSA